MDLTLGTLQLLDSSAGQQSMTGVYCPSCLWLSQTYFVSSRGKVLNSMSRWHAVWADAAPGPSQAWPYICSASQLCFFRNLKKRFCPHKTVCLPFKMIDIILKNTSELVLYCLINIISYKQNSCLHVWCPLCLLVVRFFLEIPNQTVQWNPRPPTWLQRLPTSDPSCSSRPPPPHIISCVYFSMQL
jgi:hypothetical protein